jgi:hypothetical protein
MRGFSLPLPRCGRCGLYPSRPTHSASKTRMNAAIRGCSQAGRDLAPACLRSRARRARATLVEERKRESASGDSPDRTRTGGRQGAPSRDRGGTYPVRRGAAGRRYRQRVDNPVAYRAYGTVLSAGNCIDGIKNKQLDATERSQEAGIAAVAAGKREDRRRAWERVDRGPSGLIADCSRSRSLRARTFLRSSKSVTAGRRSSPAKFRRQMARADRRSDLRRRHPRSHRVQRPPHQSHRRQPAATSNRATEGCSRASLPPSPSVREKAFRHITCEAPAKWAFEGILVKR